MLAHEIQCLQWNTCSKCLQWVLTRLNEMFQSAAPMNGGHCLIGWAPFLFLYLLHMTVSCDYYISNTHSCISLSGPLLHSLSGFLFWFAHTRLCALWLLNHDPLLEAPTLSQRPSHLCNQVPTSRSVTGNADTLDEWVPIGPNSSLSRWRVLSPLDSLTEFKKYPIPSFYNLNEIKYFHSKTLATSSGLSHDVFCYLF